MEEFLASIGVTSINDSDFELREFDSLFTKNGQTLSEQKFDIELPSNYDFCEESDFEMLWNNSKSENRYHVGFGCRSKEDSSLIHDSIFWKKIAEKVNELKASKSDKALEEAKFWITRAHEVQRLKNQRKLGKSV